MEKTPKVVTLDLGKNNTASNTYYVARTIGNDSLLSHPLFPGCYILRPTAELDQVLAKLKCPTERCLDFANKYKHLLHSETAKEIEALSLYFVVRKELIGGQMRRLADYCGYIAKIECRDDTSLAVKIVNDNKALLNYHNLGWYQNFEAFFTTDKMPSPPQRVGIFNITGFVLAQMEGTHENSI